MLDRLRQIAIFAKAIHHGSFRGAANELRLSPSVVSHHISQLEEKLGVALIYRTTRRLTLTREGETLLKSATAMLAAAEEGLGELSDQSAEPSGELRVSLPSVLAQSPLMENIFKFKNRYPKIWLQLDFSDERKNLVNDGYDLAIRMSPSRDRAQNRQSLFKMKRFLVATPEYLERHPVIKVPEDLNKCDWIELSPVRKIKPTLYGNNEMMVQLSPQTIISTNDAYAAYQLVKLGAGVTSVPEFLARDDLKAEQVQLILPDWELSSLDAYAEWPLNAPKAGISRLFVSFLR
jgi:DNA-binding transcriptional LysR family regulator